MTADYFYDYIDGLLSELGVWNGKAGGRNIPSARGLLRVVQVKQSWSCKLSSLWISVMARVPVGNVQDGDCSSS